MYIFIKTYLAAGHEAGGDCLAPGAHHLADRDLCVRHPGVASVAIKPDHPPGTCEKKKYINLLDDLFQINHNKIHCWVSWTNQLDLSDKKKYSFNKNSIFTR